MHADIARVRSEHDDLDRRADELQKLIIEGSDRCADAFDRLASYANVLSEHLLGEHEVLEDAHGRGTKQGAKQMRSELETLRWDWEEYLSVWTRDTAHDDWDTFCEHSLVMLDRIRTRIRKENELLGA
jgi:hypothetical protein